MCVTKDNHISIQELSLSLQSQKAAAEENAESEMGTTFRMNNAAMNEFAALWYDLVENYRHTNAILRMMYVQMIQTQLMSPDFTFSSEPSSTSL